MNDLVRAGRHFLTHGERSIVPIGAHVVPREGPDWPWRVDASAFAEAFAQLAALGMNTARIDLLWEAVEPDAGGYDEKHLRVLDEVLESAREHGLWLHPALFVGGEVGDAFWDVPWRAGRNPHADEELRELQARHARLLAQRWRADPTVIAWDLTDEPPYWITRDTSDDDALAWTRRLTRTLREVDPDHLVTIGTASQEVDAGPFRADIVAHVLDFGCVHPYAIYSPELYPDTLLDPRMTHSAAFETALAASAGRPVMVHEFGASSAQYDPDHIARYDRLLMWSSFGRGAIGFLAWCWSDAEVPAYRRAPYSRQPHETQFGIVDRDGAVRPRGLVLAELAATLRQVDLDAYASHGPRPGAAVMVPHEYAHPYDVSSYGLGEAAGSYEPAERAWSPDRDVKPLVRGWLNSFLLAAQAGVSVSFPREVVNDAWPDARLVLLPAPLTTTTNSLLHVRTGFWANAADYVERGGTAYLSLSADSAIPEMDAFTGCRISDRARAADTFLLRFLQPWGGLSAGDVLVLPAAPEDLGTRGVRLRISDGQVVAIDADGQPALVVARRGQGKCVTCSHPIELLLARLPDAHRRYPDWWRLYEGLAELSGAREPVWVDHPDVTTGVLHGPRGGVVTFTNHGDSDVDVAPHMPPGTAPCIVRSDGVHPLGDQPLRITAGGAVMMVWDDGDI